MLMRQAFLETVHFFAFFQILGRHLGLYALDRDGLALTVNGSNDLRECALANLFKLLVA